MNPTRCPTPRRQPTHEETWDKIRTHENAHWERTRPQRDARGAAIVAFEVAEMHRQLALKKQREAKAQAAMPIPSSEDSGGFIPQVGRVVDGGSFVLDAPEFPPAIWGDGAEVAWAQGEALMICGPAGVGKTTLAVQLVAARCGIGPGSVLGLPVQPGRAKVLYLAMDRPPQIARAMARVFKESDREALDQKLVVWKGPPPHDMAKRPSVLADMCREMGADTVVVDSLKDAVLKLSEDESGSGYNRARQQALVAGVEVIELHHQRKASGDNKRPNQLADVYGSTWLTAGAGSVLMLWGEAGDPVVQLSHLKQPLQELGPWQVLHDHSAGISELHHPTDVLSMIRVNRDGLTPRLLAVAMFSTEKPTEAQLAKARRKLQGYVDKGLAVIRKGHGQQGDTFHLAAMDIEGDERGRPYE